MITNLLDIIIRIKPEFFLWLAIIFGGFIIIFVVISIIIGVYREKHGLKNPIFKPLDKEEIRKKVNKLAEEQFKKYRRQ